MTPQAHPTGLDILLNVSAAINDTQIHKLKNLSRTRFCFKRIFVYKTRKHASQAGIEHVRRVQISVDKIN
jgi:hypothetical protein